MKTILTFTKSEIVLLEAITLIAGFFLAFTPGQSITWIPFLLTLLGVSALALGAGGLNQIQERHEDAKMDRTRARPLPSQKISLRFAIWTVAVLFLVGFVSLAFVSTAIFTLGALAVFSYNILYTLWWKRKMAFAAIPGAIPGALPVYIGYQVMAKNLLDARGLYLFALLFFWQMPHFWVLALKYSNDYDQGGFPTLPVAKGSQVTRFQITLWCLSYAALGLLSSLFFPSGIMGAVGSTLVSLYLLLELNRFLKKPEKETWLRFFLAINFSLLLYLFVISLDLLFYWVRSKN